MVCANKYQTDLSEAWRWIQIRREQEAKPLSFTGVKGKKDSFEKVQPGIERTRTRDLILRRIWTCITLGTGIITDKSDEKLGKEIFISPLLARGLRSECNSHSQMLSHYAFISAGIECNKIRYLRKRLYH